MYKRPLTARMPLVAASFFFALPASAVTINWVTVPGTGTPNACDAQPDGCVGAVTDTYLIGTHEVTNAQYAAFLRAVAARDANGLYKTNMGWGYGGITLGDARRGKGTIHLTDHERSVR